MTKKLIIWLPTVYLGTVLIYYLPNFLFGAKGVVRPSDIHDGKINAEYAINLIAMFSTQARNLYLFLFVGFIVSICVRLQSSKTGNKA